MDKDLVSEISYESQINMNILREDEDGKVSILIYHHILKTMDKKLI